jgi:hypothetical protein
LHERDGWQPERAREKEKRKNPREVRPARLSGSYFLFETSGFGVRNMRHPRGGPRENARNSKKKKARSQMTRFSNGLEMVQGRGLRIDLAGRISVG